MTHRPVILLATEEKDVFSMEAFADPLRRRGLEPFVVLFTDEVAKPDGGVLARFLAEPAPLVVIASTRARIFLDTLRNPDSYVTVGVEHGTSPFKAYTYGRPLLASDYYLAPTALWLDRLSKLYPEAKDKLRLGGYPRVNALKELRTTLRTQERHPAIPDAWCSSPVRKVVILSWGANAEALRTLPDRSDIVYLLHPADVHLRNTALFTNAQALLSEPSTAAFLLTRATILFGDFSSLTLEAAAMGLPAYFFLERSLYTTDCDLGADFFRRGTAAFAAVPHTNVAVPADSVLDLAALRAALSGEAPSVAPARFPESMLVPAHADNRDLTADHILDIATNAPAKRFEKTDSYQHCLGFGRYVVHAYRDILKRVPDVDGYAHYVGWLDQTPGPLPAKAFKLFHNMAESGEGQRALAGLDWPTVSFPTKAG